VSGEDRIQEMYDYKYYQEDYAINGCDEQYESSFINEDTGVSSLLQTREDVAYRNLPSSENQITEKMFKAVKIAYK